MMKIPAQAVLAAFVVLGSMTAVGSQDGKPEQTVEDFTFRVQSQLVQIYLTVTDGARRITDLKPGDFGLMEDGIERKMERLDAGTVPLNVALLLDCSESMREALATTQEAAAFFVESMSPGDRVTLIPFNSDIRSIPQLTDDRGPILHAIRSTRAWGATKLYDSLLFAMKNLSGKEGRKAIVVFSDGEDTGRASTLNVVLNAAARYGFPIYTIGAGSGLKRDPLKRVLRQLGEINSGKTYFVEDPRDLRGAFDEVASELRSAYVLNYYTDVPYDGRWHDVRISINNTRFRIHSRKGFYAKTGGSSSLLSEMNETRRPGQLTVDRTASPTTPDERVARSATNEILRTPVVMREIDARPLQLQSEPAAAKKPELPVFKVESRLVEVPVLVESPNTKNIRPLTEKDFRVYEDDNLREIVFFSRDTGTDDVRKIRDRVLQKVNEKQDKDIPITLSSDSADLKLGRTFLVVDDMMTEIGALLRTKKAAEEIIRQHHNPLRALTMHFTSESSADIAATQDVEGMIQRVRKALPRAGRDLTSNDNIMSVYEAYLIERGDKRARQLAELRYASSLFVHFRNELGEVDGNEGTSAESIENAIINMSRQLISDNFSQVSRALDGLRAVVNAAVQNTDAGNKVVIFLSSGFSIGRASGRGDMAGGFDSILDLARKNRIRFVSIDASGLNVDEPLGIGASGSFLVRNPHLSSILADHARGWRMDRQEPLSQMALTTSGKFIHSSNDLTGATSEALQSVGQLYYLGYLSRQAADGRYHRIRVNTAMPGARVFARPGYYAGRQNAPETLAATTPEGEDWSRVLAQANEARRAGDVKGMAENLEKLVRRFPNQADLWFNLGAAHLNLGNSQRAVETLQKAYALAPDDRNTALALSQAFLAAGYRVAAGETLELLTRRAPKDAQLLMQLGRIYESDARPMEAYQTYRRILDFDTAPPLDLYLLLTRTSLRLGRRVEAQIFVQDYLSRGGNAAQLDPWKQLISMKAR